MATDKYDDPMPDERILLVEQALREGKYMDQTWVIAIMGDLIQALREERDKVQGLETNLGIPHPGINQVKAPKTLLTHRQMGKLTTPNLAIYRNRLCVVPIKERGRAWKATYEDCLGILKFRGVIPSGVT